MIIAAVALLGLGAAPCFAQTAQGDMFNEAVRRWNSPDSIERGSAIFALGEAQRLAFNAWDPYVMLAVSQLYLAMGREFEAQFSLGSAVDLARYRAFADSRVSNSGQDCEGGRAAFRTIGGSMGYFVSNSRDEAYRRMMVFNIQSAIDQADWIDSRGGCVKLPRAPVAQTVLLGAPARPGYNALAGNNPTKGFGYTGKVDLWVPFQFDYGAPQNIVSAKISMVVSTVDQLIGTDQLVVKGASGQSYMVYDQFASLKAGAWNTLEVDLSRNQDIMAAVRSGHVEALIQDDTDVQSATLVVGVVMR
jgi:hypothetical protein